MRLPPFILYKCPELVCALLFVAFGCLFLPYPGLQNDEVLFAVPLIRSSPGVFSVHSVGHEYPLMLLTYLGTLKTSLYAALLHFPVSYRSIRAPALLIGSAGVWIYIFLLKTLHSRRAAWAGGLLLVSDSIYLLTTCFDWGPVALQHFFLAAGVLCAVGFHRRGAAWRLGLAFLFFGLGLWDKALFVWMLTAIAGAFALIYPRLLWKHLTFRNAGVAALGFSMGAAPLLWYNLSSGFPTFRSNAAFTLQNAARKGRSLRQTWQGDILFNYLVFPDTAPGNPGAPSNLAEGAAFRIHALAGGRWVSHAEPALIAAALLIPLLWRTRARRPLLFCLTAFSLAWTQILVARDAGAAHHTILLWPLPCVFVAIAFSEASFALRRYGAGALAVAIAYLAAGNLLVMNQYLYQMVRNGSPGSWNDGIYALARGLPQLAAGTVVITDWGILPSLDVLKGGALPLRWAGDPWLPPMAGESEKKQALDLLAEGRAVWVAHTAAFEQFAGVNQRVLGAAHALGFEKRLVATFSDRYGRPVFEVFRFTPDRLE